jgi:hypothetical protein
MHIAIDMMLDKWEQYSPEFREALEVLTEIEKTKWDTISLDSDLQDKLKHRLLSEAWSNAWSEELLALTEHGPRWYHWNDHDKIAAQGALQSYLRNNFLEERSSCSNSDQLISLQESIKELGSAWTVNVQHTLETLEEAISDAVTEEEQSRDDDGGEWRGYHHASSANSSSEEEEVRRMFGSLME